MCLTSKFMILAMWLPQDSPLMTFLYMHVMLAICHLLFCKVIYFRTNIQVFFLSCDNPMMVIFLKLWVLIVRKTTARSLERGFDSIEGLLS